MARDHLTPRTAASAADALAIPATHYSALAQPWTGSLPFIAVTLDATFYPRSGAGSLSLYRTEQNADDDPTLRHLTALSLAPLTCDTDVPDMAAYWLRAVAAATDWPSLIGIAKVFRTRADHAREQRPRY